MEFPVVRVISTTLFYIYIYISYSVFDKHTEHSIYILVSKYNCTEIRESVLYVI